MAEPPRQDPDEELADLGAEGLRVETVKQATGERRFEGLISREHLARAVVERDELGR